MRSNVTEAQRRLLLAIRDFGGTGWCEIELQFMSGNAVPERLEAAVCARVAGALRRKGLIVDGDDGPELTDAGARAVST